MCQTTKQTTMKKNIPGRSLILCVLRSRNYASFRVIFVLIVGLVLYLVYILQTPYNTQNVYNKQISTTGNGTEGEAEVLQQKLVVNTPTCKIPEMNPWDDSIADYLQPDSDFPKNCHANQRVWSFVDGQELVMNLTAIHESGYSWHSIRCCYRTIDRVQQHRSSYDENADNYVKYSSECYSLKQRQKIDADYIRVQCISTSFPLFEDVVYREFYAIAQPNSDREVSRKISNWRSKKDRGKPPNVVIVGIDNNSRMNSHRALKKTLEILKKIGAVEMMGYTKVAENTFPNTVPFLSGHSEESLKSVCYSETKPQDDCPYLWKAFHQVGFVTVSAEDAPLLGGFNYLKTGFLNKPADFYLRTLMLAVSAHLPRSDYYHTNCIGRFMTDEIVFNYILELIKVASDAPVFVHSWLTSLAHHNYNNIRFEDESLSKFVKRLEETKNTVFFFMSDHGQRYGPIRETHQGWYEDKLPTQWIYIPSELRKKFPDWYTSLNINSRRLTSHFDLYKTMLHILQTFDSENSAGDFYNKSISLLGQSLFKPVPDNRTCDDAGVPVNYCACSTPQSISVEDSEVTKAANYAVKHLASLLPSVCAEPSLKTILNAKYMRILNRLVYVISLVTNPGEFMFEVNVEEDGDMFVVNTELLRMNKISRAANCVNTSLLERYCYCN